MNHWPNKQLRRGLITGFIGFFVGAAVSFPRWEIAYALVYLAQKDEKADADIDAIGWVSAILWTAPLWLTVVAFLVGFLSVRRNRTGKLG